MFAMSFVDGHLITIIVVDLFIALLMILALKYLSGLVANADVKEELAQKDNFAFGLAIMGGILALSVMMTGVLSGEAQATLWEEIVLMLTYSIVGLLLIKVGRLIQDRWILRNFDIQKEIKNGNLAAAYVDIAHTISVGIILRAVMIWVDSYSWVGAIFVILGFFLSQLVLVLVSQYRFFIYGKRHPGACLQEAFKGGNKALAIRYLGHVIGSSIAITAASGMSIYVKEQLMASFLIWTVLAFILIMIVSLIAIVLRRVILAQIDFVDEVDRQQNIGIASIEAAIYISVGLFFAALFT